MTAYGARRTVLPPLQAAGDRVRRVIARLFPVRPERRPGAIPALPLARKETIKADPSRYGCIDRAKTPDHPPWETSAVLPALTDAVLAELDALRVRALRSRAPGPVPGLFERLHSARNTRPGGAA